MCPERSYQGVIPCLYLRNQIAVVVEIVIPQTTGHVGLRIFAPEYDPQGAIDYYKVEIKDQSIGATARIRLS